MHGLTKQLSTGEGKYTCEDQHRIGDHLVFHYLETTPFSQLATNHSRCLPANSTSQPWPHLEHRLTHFLSEVTFRG